MTYSEKLRKSAEEAGNIFCLGLDPVLPSLPYENEDKRVRLNKFFSTLFKAARRESLIPAAFKVNIGYWASLDRAREEDFSGSLSLSDTLEMIEMFFPSSPIILDSKRADISSSSKNYKDEAFETWKADALTVHPYMGNDSVLPFVKEEKGVYVLIRTSNKGSSDFQGLTLKDGDPLYLRIAKTLLSWREENEGLGAVLGATGEEELIKCLKLFKSRDIPILIPGVGSQGGSAKRICEILDEEKYEKKIVRINASSSVTHPWKTGPAPEDAIDICLTSLRKHISEASL